MSAGIAVAAVTAVAVLASVDRRVDAQADGVTSELCNRS